MLNAWGTWNHWAPRLDDVTRRTGVEIMDEWDVVRELNRREFLRSAGLAAAGIALGGSGVLLPRRAVSASGVREIELIAKEVRWELAPGKVLRAMTYNGQVPGPALRLHEGERVRISLKNELPEPTTIHWHGVDVPNAMDGVPGITQKPVQPGETFVYEFEARPAGTRWCHSHFQEHKQMDLGLVAPLIIDPADPEPFAVDREDTLVLDDWATGTGPALPRTTEGIAGARGSMGGMMGGMMGGGMGRMMEGMMGGRGMGGMMGGAMMGMGGRTPAYDTMTINGKA